MVVKFCPRCNQRYVAGFDCNDFVHDCNSGNLALDQEDVVIMGNWEGGSKSPQDVLRQGLVNELQDQRGGIEGVDKEALTRRGVRASTHRQRQHQEFINIPKEKLD